MDRGPDFYLASSDYYTLEKPRHVWWLNRVSTPQRNDLLLARIDPPIAYRAASSSALEIAIVLLATRHQGASLFPIAEWPVFVHVARPLITHIETRDEVRDDEFESIAWAELYGTEEDARKTCG